MPRAKNPIIEVAVVGEEPTSPVLPDPESITEPPEQGAQKWVTQEEHDRAVRALRDEISGLKETVSDLERIVTQPEGAVTWHEVQHPISDEPVPYIPTGQEPDSQDDGIPFYTPPYLRD